MMNFGVGEILPILVPHLFPTWRGQFGAWGGGGGGGEIGGRESVKGVRIGIFKKEIFFKDNNRGCCMVGNKDEIHEAFRKYYLCNEELEQH